MIYFTSFSPGHHSRLFARLYDQAEAPTRPGYVTSYPPELTPYLTRLFGPDLRVAMPMQLPAKPVTGDGRMLVGFSGGKDSTATAIKAKAEGFTPVLFYVQGINPSYPGEKQAAVNTARVLGLELVTVGARYAGERNHLENPTKNQLILAMMADYGAGIGIADHAMGLMESDMQDSLDYSAGYSDAIELHLTAADYLARMMPGYALHRYIENDTDSLKTITEQAPAALDTLLSCMTPHRFQAMRRRQTRDKFGVDLLPNRCGACYKCAVEWLHLRAWGHAPDKPDYRRRCIDLLRAGAAKTYGPRAAAWNDHELLEQYLDGVHVNLGALTE